MFLGSEQFIMPVLGTGGCKKWLLEKTTVLSQIVISVGFFRSRQVTPVVTTLFTIELSAADCKVTATLANIGPSVLSHLTMHLLYFYSCVSDLMM